MINQTKRCLANTAPNTHDGQIKCETAYFSQLNNYTYHTHPNGVLEPSDIDVATTAKHKKQFLVIGLVPSNEVVVWGPYPTYNKLVARFRL